MVRMYFVTITILFSHTMAYAQREELDLNKIKRTHEIKDTYLTYEPKVESINRNDCKVLGIIFGKGIDDFNNAGMKQTIKSYKDYDKKVFWVNNFLLSNIIKRYSLISNRDICVFIVPKPSGLFYLFKIPKHVFQKLSTRDFGKKDNQVITKALNDNARIPSNLPYSLSEAFRLIEVGRSKNIKNVKEINFDKQLTEKYKDFLDNYSFDYLGFDEDRLDTAYDNLAMQRLIDKENKNYLTEESQGQSSQHSSAYIIDWGTHFKSGNSIWGRHNVKLNNGRSFYTWLYKDTSGLGCYQLVLQGGLNEGASTCDSRINSNNTWRLTCGGSVNGNHIAAVQAIVNRCGNNR